MDVFFASTTLPAAQQFEKAMREALVTPHTFSRPFDDVVKNLRDIGIPLIPANDIAFEASKFFEAKRAELSQPLMCLWDLEAAAIPRGVTPTAVVDRLRFVFRGMGKLVAITAYASSGSETITREKRNQLERAGVIVHEVVAGNRQDRIEKRIMVDAMRFASMHPGGMTVAFITQGAEFAYLLSVMQDNRNWRTAMITTGKLRSALHLNANSTIRWEADILRPFSEKEERKREVSRKADFRQSVIYEGEASDEDAIDGLDAEGLSEIAALSSLTFEELEEDRIANVVTILRSLGGEGSPVLRVLVLNQLKVSNPIEFAEDAANEALLQRVIDRSILKQSTDASDRLQLQVVSSDETERLLQAAVEEEVDDAPEDLLPPGAHRGSLIVNPFGGPENLLVTSLTGTVIALVNDADSDMLIRQLGIPIEFKWDILRTGFHVQFSTTEKKDSSGDLVARDVFPYPLFLEGVISEWIAGSYGYIKPEGATKRTQNVVVTAIDVGDIVQRLAVGVRVRFQAKPNEKPEFSGQMKTSFVMLWPPLQTGVAQADAAVVEETGQGKGKFVRLPIVPDKRNGSEVVTVIVPRTDATRHVETIKMGDAVEYQRGDGPNGGGFARRLVNPQQ